MSDEFDDDELWNYSPKKEPPKTAWKRSRQNAAPQSTPPPWTNQALAPARLSDPSAPSSRLKYGIAVPFTGIAVVMAGIIGYKLGFPHM